MRRLIAKLGPAALLAAGFLIAGEARAEVGCFEGNPFMTCPLAECIALEAAVHAPNSCSSQESVLSSCSKVVGCSSLRQARTRWLTCYQTRVILMARCFSGGRPETPATGSRRHRESVRV